MPCGNYGLLYSGLLQAIPFNVWPCEVTHLKSRQPFEVSEQCDEHTSLWICAKLSSYDSQDCMA